MVCNAPFGVLYGSTKACFRLKWLQGQKSFKIFTTKCSPYKRVLILAVLNSKDNLYTKGVSFDRSSILLHIIFISGYSTIQQGSINSLRVVLKASEILYQ